MPAFFACMKEHTISTPSCVELTLTNVDCVIYLRRIRVQTKALPCVEINCKINLTKAFRIDRTTCIGKNKFQRMGPSTVPQKTMLSSFIGSEKVPFTMTCATRSCKQEATNATICGCKPSVFNLSINLTKLQKHPSNRGQRFVDC